MTHVLHQDITSATADAFSKQASVKYIDFQENTFQDIICHMDTIYSLS